MLHSYCKLLGIELPYHDPEECTLCSESNLDQYTKWKEDIIKETIDSNDQKEVIGKQTAQVMFESWQQHLPQNIDQDQTYL